MLTNNNSYIHRDVSSCTLNAHASFLYITKVMANNSLNKQKS